MALVAQNIHVVRGHRPLVSDVSLRVSRGEIVGLIGPNGAGKTTLLRVLSGEMHPDRGDVRYDDETIRHHTPAALARLRALLPQSQQSAFNYTAREVIALGVAPHAAANADVLIAQVADALGLATLLGQTAASLSGGELQRVRLARVLLQQETHHAHYLLLDEPTSAQDPGQAATLAAILKKRATQHNLGILIIVHDLNVAARLCDTLYLLQNGHTVAQGSPIEVLTQSTVHHAFGPGLHVTHHDQIPIILPMPHANDTQALARP